VNFKKKKNSYLERMKTSSLATFKARSMKFELSSVVFNNASIEKRK
jgi:hypothetical protein